MICHCKLCDGPEMRTYELECNCYNRVRIEIYADEDFDIETVYCPICGELMEEKHAKSTT
jgi:hypothetical protein